MIHRLDDKDIYVGNQGIDRVYLGDKVLKSNEPLIYMATDKDFKMVFIVLFNYFFFKIFSKISKPLLILSDISTIIQY